MATHSSILAWEIPWVEEPGGLQSMGSHPLTGLHGPLASPQAWVTFPMSALPSWSLSPHLFWRGMDGALCLAPSFLGTLDPACPHCALPFGASAELPLEEWVSWPGLGVKVTQALGSAGRGSPRPEQPLGRGSALSRLGAELELRRSGSSLGPSQ